jgi:hypothetical protein
MRGLVFRVPDIINLIAKVELLRTKKVLTVAEVPDGKQGIFEWVIQPFLPASPAKSNKGLFISGW